jgi:hypothetical protein
MQTFFKIKSQIRKCKGGGGRLYFFYFHNSESEENMWLAEEDMFVWRICAQVENVFSARGGESVQDRRKTGVI